nr:exodeoxyribonuclease V subunit gamma [Buchnera aphidicola]
MKQKTKKLLYYKKNFFYKKIYTNNILYKLQYDIFKNSLESSVSTKIHYENHHSLSINQCSSYLQEIQELYKYIIHILNTKKKITLNNILITADNIKPYIFYINNIFNSTKKNNSIIHSISKSNKNKKKIILTIKNLFKIKNNRFKYSWVLSLLNTKYLRKKFYIKSSDIKTLYSFISDLYIRFGFDKNQFKKMSIPKINTYSWEYAISRITTGYGAQKNYSIWNNISTYNVSCKKSNILLGNFINLIITLNQLRKKLLNKKTLKNWFHIFTKIINKFFHIPLKYKKFFFILENKWKNIVSEGIIMNYSEKISIDIITDIFFKNSYSLFKHDAFFTGKINITNLKNVRTIPFKMICVLGCIQGNTPSLKKIDGLNPSSKKIYHDNKNIFFETIMSTQKYFFCSFVKTTVTESTSYASKYIMDIIFYLKKIFYIKKNVFTKKKKNYINNIYIKHEYQTNHSYFINQKTEYLLHKKNFFNNYKKIKKTTQKNISIKKLINFWKNPIQYYFKKILKIPKIDNTTEILSEDELFSINSLNQYYINKKILKKKILNKKTNSLYKKLKLQNKIPYGYVGKVLWKKQEKKINILAKKINALRNSPTKKKINIKIKKYKLSGIVKEINAYGLIRWSASQINYKIIISTWIEHIIYCSLHSRTKSILLGINNSSIKFLPLKKNKAKKYLKKYLQGYLDGIKKPILILNSGIIWLQSLYIPKYRILNTNTNVYIIAKRNFLKKWNGNSFFAGEKKNIYVQKLIPYINTTQIKKICNTCKYWLLPLLKNSNIKKYHLK